MEMQVYTQTRQSRNKELRTENRIKEDKKIISLVSYETLQV